MFLGISLEELVDVVRTCDSIEIDTCTPNYLQEFLAKRLDTRFAVLAAKVRNFNDAQMEALCHYIRDTHLLIRP